MNHDPARAPLQEGQESAWDYPRPPCLEAISQRLIAKFAGETIADTINGFRVLETSHPPVYYFPPSDVRQDLVAAIPGSSFCEFKGVASYVSIVVGARRSEKAGWFYPQPTVRFAPLANHIAFYASMTRRGSGRNGSPHRREISTAVGLRPTSSGRSRVDPAHVAGSSPADAFPPGGHAVVVGASGGIGRTLLDKLKSGNAFKSVTGFSRSGERRIDLEDEATIAAAAAQIAALGEVRLVIDATGFLHDSVNEPEKTWRAIDPQHMAKAFVINAIGPALLMKHFLPLLPRDGRSVFATLSAKVGSISDNRLGGWYSYRASKAALNQLVRTAAIEFGRNRPEALCVALHPGTVDTGLSRPFAKAGLAILSPADAAADIIAGIDRLGPEESGGFFDRHGDPLPW